jgi:hypothetical protein
LEDVPMSDEEFALRLQLQMNGAGSLSGDALDGLGLSAAPVSASDMKYALQIGLVDAGAGVVDAATIASLTASLADASLARLFSDNQGRLIADAVVAEMTARHEMMPNSPNVNIEQRMQDASEDGSSIDCPVCLEPCAAVTAMRLGSCAHSICATCARLYLTNVGKERKDFPIPCPADPSCREPLDPQLCLGAMAGTDMYAALDTFMVEKVFMSRICYCIDPRCGAAFDVSFRQDSARFAHEFHYSSYLTF